MIWAALDPRFHKPAPLVIGGLTIAEVLFGTQQATTPLLWQLLAGPGNAIADMYKLVTSEEPARSARLNAFTSNQFVNFRMENQVVDRLRALGAGPTAPVYVLGDIPVLYILLRQPPPYHSNDYNASVIFDQRRVVEWTEKTRPAFVVWRHGDLSFDGFARAMRVPLIYSAVAAEYVPLEIVGSFTVLRRRQPGEPPAIAWWRAHLTPTVELGSILRRTGAADQPICAGTDFTTCMRVLRAELPAEVRSSGRIVIPCSVGEHSFEIAFTSHPLQESYFIALEHMWFWTMAQAANLEPTVSTPLDGRIRIEETWKKRDENLLY